MLGTFQYIIGKNASVLGLYMEQMQEGKYDSKWWIAFEEKLSICINKRNKCCHDGLFRWKDLSQLLAGMFLESGSSPKLSGLMFESEAGKWLKNTPC